MLIVGVSFSHPIYWLEGTFTRIKLNGHDREEKGIGDGKLSHVAGCLLPWCELRLWASIWIQDQAQWFDMISNSQIHLFMI